MRVSLTFAGHRCCDHSPSSGYDQVCTLFPKAGWLDGRRLVAGELSWLRAPSDRPADGAAPVVHVLYADCSGSLLPAILRRRFPDAAIVGTVHQPVDRMTTDPAARAALQHLDSVVAVSRAQARELAARGDLAVPVHVVPHGVWTRVFRPSASPAPGRPRPRDSVLLIGTYLRDWPGAQRILGRLAAAGVRSVVVGAGAAQRLKIDDPLVHIFPRMPEEELARRYSESAALILPVVDATASNALLEAMAAGCPVVCPRLPSLVEYLGDDEDCYPPGEDDDAVARLLRYVCAPDRREARSQVLMRRAETFDWPRLKIPLQAVYRTQQGHGSRSTGT